MTAEKKLIEALMEMDLIPPGFMGQLVLHIGQGPSISDAERHETGLIRRMKQRAPDKNRLDIGLKAV